ncbi:MAG TPA: FtsX-like permease family protein, partial [Caulobacteraceae bacterium]|nr:FtsX-like permease family protein [Caulobacteraceae bacterium]
ADPGLFKVLPLPVLAGDPAAALRDPNGLVLTRRMARKYLGEDTPIGKTLMVTTARDLQLAPGEEQLFSSSHPMRVEAVLQDIPSETHLQDFGIFGSGRAPWSILAYDDRHPSRFSLSVDTYARLAPGVSAGRIRAGLAAFTARHWSEPQTLHLRLEPLENLHFTPGARVADAGIAAVGALVIVIAAINFVTLMTARATRRAVEVGIRKVVGARCRDLMIQFLGEALIYVLAAMVIGVALVELALPAMNAFLQRTIAFDYLHDPVLASAILAAVLATGLLAGLYPAVVLSGFRPAAALKGGVGRSGGSAHVREVLVVVQFAILTGLIILTATIYRQTSFALQNALRFKADQVVMIDSSCDTAFKQELTLLPGVELAACVSANAVGWSFTKTFIQDPRRGRLAFDSNPIDVGFFEMHGMKPLAGRFFSKDQGEDVVLDRPGAGPDAQPTVVVNESGLRLLGLSPRGAIGKSINWGRWSAAAPNGSFPPFRSSHIIGVAPDFTLASIRTPIDPALYFVDPKGTQNIFVQIDGRRVPETLPLIDRLWRSTGHSRPIERGFEDQEMQSLYRDIVVQEVIIGACAGLAIVIACLGLFALAAFTAERRIKEIGVRKAMGASTLDVVKLLLWQFTKPVLWANLIAWPVAFWAADQWLHGFAYRVSLPPWLFLGASIAAVLIAWATVGGQAWLVARAKPATALRYE